MPSIKQKIAKMHNQEESSGLGGDDIADDASFISLVSGGDDQKSNKSKSDLSSTLASIDVTSKIIDEAERLTKRFNAQKSLERLTLPTPATLRKTEFLKSKCNKFSSFDSLEKALKRDTKTMMSASDMNALKKKYQSQSTQGQST